MGEKVLEKNKSLLLTTIFSVSLLGLANYASAEEDTTLEARNYINSNVEELNQKLSALEKSEEKIDLSMVEGIIDETFLDNPVPQEVINDKSLTIDDVFPTTQNKVASLNSNNVLNFEDVMMDTDSTEDSNYEFSTSNSELKVYIGDTGEIMLLNRSEVPDLSISQSPAMITTAAAASKTTRTERTTAIAYNALGLKMFTLTAEGNFVYNGTSVRHANSDGTVKRHLFGSTLVLEKQKTGATRIITIGSYKQPEVYTRVYFEAQFGIRWAGVTMNSGTVEAYVGATKTGNLYGGTKRLN